MKPFAKTRYQRFTSISALAALSASFITAPFNINAETDFSDPTIKIMACPKPIFPVTLNTSGVSKGFVEMLIVVDNSGILKDFVTVRATHKAFAKAVESVIERWEFALPLNSDEEINLVQSIQINFESSGVMVVSGSGTLMDAVYLNKLTDDSTNAIRLVPIADLDSIPEPILVKQPNFSKKGMEESPPLRAVFEFYIDQTGKVHVPTLREGEGHVDESILLAIQNALWNWRFTPPTKNGRPVLVKAAQPFILNLRPENGPTHTTQP